MSEVAKVYRGCAEHARLAAKATAHADHRIIFEELARSYEAKAKDSETIQPPPDGTQNKEPS